MKFCYRYITCYDLLIIVSYVFRRNYLSVPRNGYYEFFKVSGNIAITGWFLGFAAPYRDDLFESGFSGYQPCQMGGNDT